MYKIEHISAERWILISGDDSFYFPDEFLALVGEYSAQLGGELTAVSPNTQFTVSGDPLKLIFQWDSCFGIAVVVPTEADITATEKAIRHLCDILNEKLQKS